MQEPFSWLKIILAGSICLCHFTDEFSQSVERERLMVAYVNSFAKNIEWTEEKEIFRIQVVTSNEVLIKEFNSLALIGTVKGVPIEVTSSSSLIISQQVDLVFVSNEFNEFVKSIYDQIKGEEILLITDSYQYDEFIMINFVEERNQTINFKLNRANITNQGLNILPKMILLGGSDVDVASLYSQVQDSIKNLAAEMDLLQSQFDEVKRKISKSTQEIERQKGIILNQEDEIKLKQDIIASQQHYLDSLLTNFTKSESGLIEISSRLKNREVELSRLQQEIKSQNDQIEDGKLILEEQFRLIKDQDDLIRDKEASLDKMGSTIDDQERTVFLLILFSTVALIFLLLLLRAYRIRRNQARLLSEQKDELSQLLDELREAQSQLVQSEKMASLGVLTAGIAHEINNAMNFVVSGIHVLEQNFETLAPVIKKVKRLKADDLQQQKKIDDLISARDKIGYNKIQKIIIEVVKNVKIGAERTTTIVKGLRSFSRSETATVEKIDIHQDIDVALILLQNRHKNSVKIIKKLDPNISTIDGFSGQMGQVFLNIIGNALDALMDHPNPEIHLKTKLKRKSLFISIKDNGAGMDQEVLDKIFDPFFTTKGVGLGTGLGLSITYGIIEKHKGEIKVNSKKNNGTEFIISLPLKIDI